MNAAQHVIWATRDLHAQNRNKWDVQDILRSASAGAEVIQSVTKYIQATSSLSTVQSQRDYDYPTDILQITDVIWDPSGQHLPLEKIPFKPFIQHIPVDSTTPFAYTPVEQQRKLYMYPTPDANAATDVLGANMLITDSSLTGTDLSGFPAGPARIKINDEVMEYNNKNSAGTQLEGIKRGMEGTQVVAHTSADTITYRNVMVYGTQRIRPFAMSRYYVVGNVDVTLGSTAVAGNGTTWTGRNVLRNDELGITVDTINTDPQVWYPVSHTSSATALVLQSKYLEATLTKRAYIISSPNPVGDMFDDAIHYFILAQSAIRDGDKKMVTDADQKFRDAIGLDAQEVWESDRQLTVGDFPVNSGHRRHHPHYGGYLTHGMRVPWT